MDEPELIRAAQQGDQRAFEQLVRLYDQSVLRLATNLLRSPEEANDIYQEAFLRVYKNLHTFRFDCSFHTWLYRIVSNLCLDALRKRKVRREESSVVETSEGLLDRMDAVPEQRADGDPERQPGEPGTEEANSGSFGRIDAAGAGGFRDETLPGHAPANDWGSDGHVGGSREELPVPGDAENARGFRRFRMTCEEARKNLPLFLYGELSFDEEELVEMPHGRVRVMPCGAGSGEGDV